MWTSREYGSDASDPVCYDLAEAIRAWLQQNGVYKGLSMCEVALIDPHFKKVRKLVQPANVFWSHAQRETVGSMYRHMIVNGGGRGAWWARSDARHRGDWPTNSIWVDMFSLRQGTSDFNVRATVELIKKIGAVDATGNDGYFQRSLCLLETYALYENNKKDDVCLHLHNVDEDVILNSREADARNPKDADQVRDFIKETFGGGDEAFRLFDKAIRDAIKRTKTKRQFARDREVGIIGRVKKRCQRLLGGGSAYVQRAVGFEDSYGRRHS